MGSVFLELSVSDQAQTFSSKLKITFWGFFGLCFVRFYFPVMVINFAAQCCPWELGRNSLENASFLGWDAIAWKPNLMAGSCVNR